MDWPSLTFAWPGGPTNIGLFLPTGHSGVVVATFFDGHTEKVSNITQFPQ